MNKQNPVFSLIKKHYIQLLGDPPFVAILKSCLPKVDVENYSPPWFPSSILEGVILALFAAFTNEASHYAAISP